MGMGSDFEEFELNEEGASELDLDGSFENELENSQLQDSKIIKKDKKKKKNKGDTNKLREKLLERIKLKE